jgi:hypothetical protein
MRNVATKKKPQSEESKKYMSAAGRKCNNKNKEQEYSSSRYRASIELQGIQKQTSQYVGNWKLLLLAL